MYSQVHTLYRRGTTYLCLGHNIPPFHTRASRRVDNRVPSEYTVSRARTSGDLYLVTAVSAVPRVRNLGYSSGSALYLGFDGTSGRQYSARTGKVPRVPVPRIRYCRYIKSLSADYTPLVIISGLYATGSGLYATVLL